MLINVLLRRLEEPESDIETKHSELQPYPEYTLRRKKCASVWRHSAHTRLINRFRMMPCELSLDVCAPQQRTICQS